MGIVPVTLGEVFQLAVWLILQSRGTILENGNLSSAQQGIILLINYA